MQTYEVEVKSLLGSEENAAEFKDRLLARSGVEQVGSHSQLNHYFSEVSDWSKLSSVLSPHLDEDQKVKLDDLLEKANSLSVRTRDADGKVFIVVKASVGTDTSANGVQRMEFQEELPLSLEVLDSLLLEAGLEYQAKWSREREEYRLDGFYITIDRNAGYGYLAEIEKEVKDPEFLDQAHKDIHALMGELGIEELPQERLERMFAHYNEHWREYYGTDNVFTIE